MLQQLFEVIEDKYLTVLLTKYKIIVLNFVNISKCKVNVKECQNST